ncbi:hypothetical protein CEV31_4297 [Brucella thiophenivorans]|uniref:Uncharacterized protein n=1 Tax=Brucella thiophenivorans TaxID=571255 RepID=A0A256FTT0_9HYPH|nr:hypothetical protein CEV31_4297 [Brucella thiophenivorans]
MSHFGDCWITENAHVYDNAHVSKRALATHAAELFGNAILTDRARAMNSSKIFGNGVVDRDITLFEDVMIIGKIDFIKNDFDELDGKNGLIAAGDFNIFLMRSEKHYPDTYSENFSYSEFIQIVPKDAAVDDGFGLAVFYEGNHICQSYIPKTDAFVDGKKIAIVDPDAHMAVSRFLDFLANKINLEDRNNLKEILNWHIKPLKVLGSG